MDAPSMDFSRPGWEKKVFPMRWSKFNPSLELQLIFFCYIQHSFAHMLYLFSTVLPVRDSLDTLAPLLVPRSFQPSIFVIFLQQLRQTDKYLTVFTLSGNNYSLL